MIETRIENAFIINLLGEFAREVMDGRPYNEVIERHASPYIERWMLARKATVPTFVATRTRVPVVGAWEDDPRPVPSELENLYLHHYLRPDPEDMHCHPWANATLVVIGSYVEDTPEGRRTRVPGDIVLRTADQRHAIADVEPGTVTFFATVPKTREWGFYPEGQFIHNTDYRAWKRGRGLD